MKTGLKRCAALLVLLLAVPRLASAQDVDLGSDITPYQRFLVYPHLQKGWESMRRGERDRALAELERARTLAPGNVAVALHLAAAYRTYGEMGRAEAVLRDQLKRTPDDARLRTALTALRAAVQPPPAAPPQARDAAVAAVPTAPPTPSGQQRAQRPVRVRRPLPVAAAPAESSTADSPAAHEVSSAVLLDEQTYKLINAGAADQATRVLLQAYPFAAGAPAERDALLQRLILLIEQQRAALENEELLPLREPLDTPALRSRQATLWATLQDCDAIRVVLGDMSPEYGHDDWMRLGDCTTAEDPLLAQQAYARAHALQPGGRGSRALGYQAYATGDYRTALDAWRSVGAAGLSGDELLGAVTTALAAGENEQAMNWLSRYRERGDPLVHRYWSLVAQAHAGSDTALATAALERAIALAPEVDDYLRLARLDHDAGRQVQLLQRAAALDRDNATVQLELGYASSRAGWPESALRAFERAAALEPDNMQAQIELGFAYWRLGLAGAAQRPLERAWRADPANFTLAKQLVYVHQRLKNNEEARRYVEQVLDAPASSIETTTDAVALVDSRFGLQRLHEDLGRRLTISLDGWSGTGVGTGTSGSQAGSHYSSYSQFEADLRLGNPPIRDGSTLSAYARVFADGGEDRSPLASQNAMLGFGLRWKPWRSQVIYLAAENQNGLDDPSRRDVLLRASASFLNGGKYSDDWHPARRGWVSRNLYLDAAHYLEAKQSAVTADYRMSYHRKVSADQTLEPYAHLQFNGAQNIQFERDVRSGIGLRWNVWHGGTRYDADPHKVSIGVEFQQAFETYLTDRNGLFVALGTRW